MTSQAPPAIPQRTVTCPVGYAVSAALFAFAVSYFHLFIFPFTPTIPGGDQLGFATGGSRIAAGQLTYRDYFQVVPPGTDLFYALLVKLFGVQTWIPGWVMCFLAAATALIITIIAARFLRGASILLPALLFAGFVLCGSLDATHHWFSSLAILAGLLVLLGGISPTRVAFAGALCGLSACFTQTKGAAAVAAFVGYFVWKNWQNKLPLRQSWRQTLTLCLPAAAVFGSVNAYFIYAAGWGPWLFSIIVFPLRYYPDPALNNWRVLPIEFLHVTMARRMCFPFVYATIPLVYIVFFAIMWRRQRKGSKDEPIDQLWQELLLIALTGFAMFLPIALAPSLKRISTVGPLAMILLAWLLNRRSKLVSCVRITLLVGAFSMAMAGALRTQLRWRTVLDLPAGRTAFTDRVEAEEYRWVLAHTHPGQFFFGMSPMYLPFRMKNPTAIDGIMPTEYTRPEQAAAMMHGLETHDVPLIILGSTRKFPLFTGLPSDHLGDFRNFLCRNYRLTLVFANENEVWERRDSPAPSAECGDATNR